MNIAIQRDKIVLRVDDGRNLLVRRVEDELISGDPFQIPSVWGGEWQRQDRIVQALSSRGRDNPRREKRVTSLRRVAEVPRRHAAWGRMVMRRLLERRAAGSSS